MKIIISPAKKMKKDDSLAYQDLPVFIEDTEKIMNWVKTLSLVEARKLWGCNEKLARENYERFQNMNLSRGLTPAILAYEGIQYQYMAPAVFDERMLSYVKDTLRILSGFYGVLKVMDGVVPYRLEMRAKTEIGDSQGLYDFWGEKLYAQVLDESRVILNLASKEYSKCVEAYLKPKDRYITCVFGEFSKGKVIQKGTYAKMARGEMVRFMAENQIQEPEEVRNFQGLGYYFSEEHSTDTEYVFLKQKDESEE